MPDRLLLILWYSLLTGLGQVGVWLVARYVVHQAVVLDPQIVWMAPVANLLVFGVAGAALFLLGRAVPAADTRRAWLIVFSVLGLYTILLMVPRIHPLALLALSIGAGLQAGRWLDRRAEGVRRLASWSVVPLAALVLVATAVINGRFMLRERAALDDNASARTDAPNVLLIIWDTVRAANLSLHGYERQTTPFLEEFAGSGVVFERALSTAPWTLSAHGSFFTGHYPYDLTAGWDVPLDGRHITLAEELAEQGYATAGFVANHIFGPAEYGLSHGFAHYEAWPMSAGRILTASTIGEQLFNRYRDWFAADIALHEKPAGAVSRRFWRWHDRVGDRPWFAFLNYFDAHEPYTPPAPFDDMFGDPQVRRVIWERRPTDQEVNDIRDAYDGAIAYLDHELRALIGRLEQAGELDNTLVIITSDHGEHLGEHGLLDHGNTLYAPLLHVPLVMRLPGSVPGGERIAQPVSLRDLPRTVLQLLGAMPDTGFPGKPLTRFWIASSSPADSDTILAQVPFAPGQPDWYPLAAGDIRSVVLWPYQLIVDGRGAEQVFDLAEDPLGLRDVAAHIPEQELSRLRAALAAHPARTRLDP